MWWVSGSPHHQIPFSVGRDHGWPSGADVTTRGCYSGVSRHNLRPAASLPENTRRWTNAELMLANINPTLVQRLVAFWGRAAWSPRGKNQTLHWIGVIRLRKWKAAASPLLITRDEVGEGGGGLCSGSDVDMSHYICCWGCLMASHRHRRPQFNI